jgi:hypothetical protein
VHFGAPHSPWIGLGALTAQLRRAVERSCFDVLGHLQAGRPMPQLTDTARRRT